jgi:hypothetical protein
MLVSERRETGMIRRFIALMVSVLFLAASAPAQTAAELLQKGIYRQQTAGKADEAIELYRQAANAAGADRATAARAQMMIVSAMIQKGDFNGASREFGTLTQNYSDQKDLMASMGSLFPAIAGARMTVIRRASGTPAQPTLGTLKDGLYKHTATGVEIRIPQGWRFEGDGPSSGNGEAASFNSGSQSYFVWMITAPNQLADVSQSLQQDVDYKLHQRQLDGVENFRIRKGSEPFRWDSANFHAISVAFEYGPDYSDGEYGIWARRITGSQETEVYFRAQCKVTELGKVRDELMLLAAQTTLP